ncbi:arginine decarboxylase-like [Jatropha curcas]|uniref:arginine decarboxylase-like n=1 Tax=Jatropha curcas TaxID=180498 RepID=UPI0009D695BB|nr:arginine decarboxylase-like [Jatropha curcas]
MSCASLSSLHPTNLHLAFPSNWTLKSLRKRTGISDSVSPERSTSKPEKKQQRSSQGKSISSRKDDSLISNFHVSQPDTSPPLVTALKALAAQNAATFHFPGHNRGQAAPVSLTQLIGLKPFIHDLTGLQVLDKLFSPEGPIVEAQKQAAKLFGSLETWFLVGGTTSGIQAAIMATCSPGEHIILPRNCHVSAISAMVLSGAIPKYIIPEYDSEWDIAGGITPLQVEKAIKELEMEGHKPAAVFVTSPTYNGICSNLNEISQLCHCRKIPLIADEAHGAHLGFHPQLPLSALKQNADLVVQSTHKVLSSLTQSSMLHMSGNIVDRERISRCLQTLQTTSPSSLLLASLDAARAQLSENPETIFHETMKLAIESKELIKKIPGITWLELPPSFCKFPAKDPLRLTVGFWQLGLSGCKAGDILYRNHGIVPELVESRSITLAINLGTCKEHVQRLVSGLEELSASSLKTGTEEKVKNGENIPFTDISMSLNPRDAFFAKKRRVSIGESLGKACGELISPYPPGIPVMIPGEVITERALDYLLDVISKGAVINGASDPQLSSIVICNV